MKGNRNYQQGPRGNEEYNFWIEEHSRRNQKQAQWTRDQISKLENKVEKNSQKQQEKEKRLKKNEEVLRELQDNMKHNNIRIMGISEGEEEQGIENLFEKVMMENFPNLMREKLTQIQETQTIPIKRNPRRPTSRHIIIKMAKFQDKRGS